MMIESVMKMRNALTAIRDGGGRDPENLINVIPLEQDFMLFDEVFSAMKQVEEMTASFSGDKTPTINRVMSHVFHLRSTLDKVKTNCTCKCYMCGKNYLWSR